MRIGEVSLGVVTGIATWWCWEPSSMSLRLGLCAYGVLLLACRHSYQGRWIVWIMAVMIGSLRLSTMVNTTDQSVESEGYTTGWVVKSNRRQALIQNETERWTVEFYPEAPTQGALVSVWHQPKVGLAHWTGGVDPFRRIQAERTGVRKAKEWIVHSEPERVRKPMFLEELNHGDILWALLSGEKSEIDPSVKQKLQRTGTSHLLAISGMHIGLMAACTYAFLHQIMGWIVLVDQFEKWGLGPFVKRLSLIGSMLMSVWYGYQVGWSASSQRAVLMVCIYCTGKGVDLSFSVWDVLGLTGMVMLLHEPSMMHDLGFQLSFAAVIGIALFGQYTHRLTSKFQSRLVNGVLLSLGMTVGATLGTLPICAWVFQSVPLTGVLANLLVTPLLATLAVPISMLGLMTDMTEYSVTTTLSRILFLVADACVELSMWLLEPLMIEPLRLAFDVLDVCMAFGCIISMALFKSRWMKFTMGLMVGVLIWINTPDGSIHRSYFTNNPELEIQFLPVGQGDATLMRWNDGTIWLIDGGPFTFDLVPYLKRQGVWHLDKVWLSHPHADHMDGLFPVLNQLDVGDLVVGRGLEPEDADGRYSALWDLARSKNVNIQLAHTIQGTSDVVNRGVRILHPHAWRVDTSDRCNEESVVLEITTDQYKVLLTGDIEEDAERELLSKISDVDLLKVAHHGSKTSSSQDLISLLKPEWSVISVGERSRFGHPHAETLWSLRNSKVLRTDWHGLIRVEFKAGSMDVSE